jgi:hypothetical protein
MVANFIEGVTMMTPAAIAFDWVFRRRSFQPLYLVGSFLVIAGFVFTNLDRSPPELQEAEQIRAPELLVERSNSSDSDENTLIVYPSAL